jgi:hypothetical protein
MRPPAQFRGDRLPQPSGGLERVVDVVSERSPNGFDRLKDGISREELAATAGGHAQTAGFAKA